MSKHKLTLLGGPSAELRVSATVLQEAIGALLEGARLATRFAVEGESVRKGPRPTWLDAVCDFEVTGLSAGSAVIAMDARTLGEVDPIRFGVGVQYSLFGETDARFGEQTAIDIFGRLLATVLEGEPDDVIADRALLGSCARFARVSGGGFDGIRLEGIRGRVAPLVIDSNDAPRIERLRDETPRPQAARIAGTLDTVSASRPDLVLALEDGTRVPGRMEEHDLEALRALLGKEVVVSGMAHYRPSGRLLLVDVEALDVARPEDRIFQKAPVARKQKVAIEPSGPSDASGVAGFFGTWPGEESDAELLQALRAIG
jgi:hypothetical protein